MRDVFYTLLGVWIVWRLLDGISSFKARQANNYGNTQQTKRKEGETSVDYAPPIKKKISDNEGEYVDYEDVK